ncbi:hypothetical protein [Kitasatospora cineracea]|uniref:hypothetical protein n=1 Tax=Kitasatospora cineracea TaxID=88074 RepID=UPI0037B875CD
MGTRGRVVVGLVASGVVLVVAWLVIGAGRTGHGKVFDRSSDELSVRAGQTFSLYWKLPVVPGTDWRPVAPDPDPAVVGFVGVDRYSDAGAPSGDGGHLYLVFKARRPGTTTIVVANCSGCDERARKLFQHQETYRVTVT